MTKMSWGSEPDSDRSPRSKNSSSKNATRQYADEAQGNMGQDRMKNPQTGGSRSAGVGKLPHVRQT